MRLFIPLIIIIQLFGANTIHPQEKVHHLAIEVEPVAYIFNGAGIHGRYQYGSWRYSFEILGLDIPESLHGNDGFDASVRAVELHFEHFFTDTPDGFFFGPEVGVSRLEVTHRESGLSDTHTGYSVGIRGGYRWYTGLGKLYLAPVGGLVYSLNAEDIELGDGVYEAGAFTPFVTVGIGWSFGL